VTTEADTTQQPRAARPPRERKPSWFKAKFPAGERFEMVRDLVTAKQLHTVCQEARCPNIGECYNSGTATFMILGDTCTRACGFCAINSGRPEAIDPLEPVRLAQAVETLGLDYAVITSVNRDDVPDGGAAIFAACIRAVRHRTPSCDVEVLIPDFEGNWDALGTVLEARPVVLNHNTESVPRLYPRVRPKGDYERTLALFRESKRQAPDIPVKTGFMVGIGERFEEMKRSLEDVREAGVELVTIGQYLQPTDKHLPVDRYVHPEEYAELKAHGTSLGFDHIEAGPLVRSSYHAGEQARAARIGLGAS
jgi:lipoic acid synthetase